MTDDAFIKTLEQETAMQAAMLNGDPGPLINYWADSDEITVFGGWGRIEKQRRSASNGDRRHRRTPARSGPARGYARPEKRTIGDHSWFLLSRPFPLVRAERRQRPDSGPA